MKTALITGANKGIGYEVARQLGGKGFQIFVGARNPQKGREAAEALKKNGAIALLLSLEHKKSSTCQLQIVIGIGLRNLLAFCEKCLSLINHKVHHCESSSH